MSNIVYDHQCQMPSKAQITEESEIVKCQILSFNLWKVQSILPPWNSDSKLSLKLWVYLTRKASVMNSLLLGHHVGDTWREAVQIHKVPCGSSFTENLIWIQNEHVWEMINCYGSIEWYLRAQGTSLSLHQQTTMSYKVKERVLGAR